MPSESERWKTGPFRNTVGTTEGATGPVTGGVEGHVKNEEPRPHQEREEGARVADVVTGNAEGEVRKPAGGRRPADPHPFRGG